MDPPTEPSKPAHESEADAALAASAANAVEQWRTYQNAYYLYQQQQAAYEHYMMKQATLTNPEEQAAAYNQYLEAHQGYQKQLEQYEQQKYYQEYYATGGQPTVTTAAGPAPVGYPVPAPYQPPPVMPVPPTYSTPLANVDPFYKKAKDHFRDRSQLKRRSESFEKKTKVYTTTTYYANPDDEQLFPAALKALFKDLECNLCMSKMNSHISANVHYQSKVHERKIIQWLKEWCETTGTPMPVRAKRKVVDIEPVGPNSLRCEACDLPLTSIQHANQHYTGKRHQMVVRGKKNPAGRGYFNKETGTWTRTSNEVVDDDRFGIGSSFKNKAHFNAREAKKAKLEPPPSPPKELMGTSTAPTTMEIPATPVYTMPPTPVYGQPPATPMYGGVPPPATPLYQAPPAVVAAPSYPPPQIAPGYGAAPAVFQTPPPTVQTTSVDAEILRKESADCVDASGVFCLVCQIGVTSKAVMETHLKGSKHLKKLKMVGRMVPRKGSAATESILETLNKPPQQNDWSLYRMPSGKYYCKSCNSIMADEKLFSQHWYGKKHKLKVKQEMEELSGKAGGGEAKGKFYNRRPFGKNRFVQPQAQ